MSNSPLSNGNSSAGVVSSISESGFQSKLQDVGLSTEKAMQQFSAIVKSTVAEWASDTRFPSISRFDLVQHASMLFMIVMFVYYDACETVTRLGLLTRMTLLIALGLWEMYLMTSRSYRRRLYFAARVQDLLSRTLKAGRGKGFAYGMPPRIPMLSKHEFVRVYRDGKLRICPGSLLVAGDVIQLLEGESEPCRVERIVDSKSPECIVLESPIVGIIGGYLESIDCVVKNMANPSNYCYKLLINITIGMSCIAHCAGFVKRSSLHDTLIVLSLLRSNIFGVLLRTWGCVRVQLVADALKKSKTPYDEATDADEFDEDAPPPSKDICISLKDILARLWHYENWSEFLHQPDLVELFGSMSVICFTDREGPISLALPSPEEIVYTGINEKLSIVGVDEWSLDYGKFAKLVEQQKDVLRLKPFGLATTACTLCYNTPSGPNLVANHRRFAHPEEYKKYIHSAALQACQCAIGRSMGMDDLQSSRLDFVGTYWMSSTTIIVFAYSDRSVSGIVRCFAVGPLLEILDNSTEYYVDGGIVEMTEGIKRALIESEEGALGRDEECLGYAFQTLFVDSFTDADFTMNSLCADIYNPELEKSFGEFCFLGSLTCSPRPREDMQEFIDDLMNAGIRFVYFGEEGERQAKTFGSRLGLETDWNGCILLSASNQVNYSAPSDIKARLPVGVDQIREHLKYVDDIPLHVSVFAGSTPEDAAEMIRIYQESGETVCVAISSLHPEHHRTASQADVCIAMDPLPSTSGGKPLWEIASEWHSLSASLSLPFESSPYILTDLIKEARTLKRSRHSSLLYFHCAAYVALVNRQFKWVPVVTLLAILINTFVVYDKDVFRQMPRKERHSSFLDLRDSIIGWAVLGILQILRPQLFGLSVVLMFWAHLHPIHSAGTIFYDIYHKHQLFTLGAIVALAAYVLHDPSQLLATIPIMTHEGGKYFYRGRSMESQKRSKLEFSTRLGMHSPV